MNQEIKLDEISDLQLASFLIRANNELQRAVQNVQMMTQEVARREQEFNKEAEKPNPELVTKKENKPTKR